MSAASVQNAGRVIHALAPATGDWWQETGSAVSTTSRIDDVADVWRDLESTGIESPGQSLEFTRAWIKQFEIPSSDQLYVTGTLGGKVVALLPLMRRRKHGLNLLTGFAGAHVGCHAPLIDRQAFAGMTNTERAEFWRRLQRGLTGADLVHLECMPALEGDASFQGLGTSRPVDLLYRSEFSSWEECDQIQRSRSRRKHDKQQGAKLEAMGEVGFEEVTVGDVAREAVETMFRQKARRFAEWGIDDPFADPQVQSFYIGLIGHDGPLQARVHILRLDGAIVAVRYNLAHGERVFALISSMDDNPDLSPGSPGKQNILRAQKHMFSSGVRMVDMGAGYSDEKRHWCNVKIELRDHLLPLTAKGRVAARLMGWKTALQHRIKNDERLFALAKSMRARAGALARRD